LIIKEMERAIGKKPNQKNLIAVMCVDPFEELGGVSIRIEGHQSASLMSVKGITRHISYFVAVYPLHTAGRVERVKESLLKEKK
jgi:hypothetical protein